MTTAEPTTCYRHPDRETGRHCTRCGNPACAECLHAASVGSQCTDCVKADATPATQRLQRSLRGQNLIATKSIIGVTVAAYIFIALRDGRTDGAGHTGDNLVLFGPLVHQGEWWRLYTASLVHVSIIHLFFNMLLVWIIGQILEPGAGPLRFTVIYVVSVLAGSAAALVAQPHVPAAGASGGVFGLAAAATLVMHRQGVSFWNTGFGPLLAINFALDAFLYTNVSIAAHVGGLIGGLLAAEAMMQARKAGQPKLGIVAALFVGVASVLLALAVAGN